ncbi:MAG: Crp/Fnr family transcriptional regulator [Bacteroidaceae bacterium]|nr:Crp/Fnr family transcriptional regulator [Bacteroidaceae bacterium]
MEHKFNSENIDLDLQLLREFCEQEGEEVCYRKGERMECEGEPANWFGFVTEGCFKYTARGIGDDKEHLTWFSFGDEFAGDYPACLYGRPSQTTIEAMMDSRIHRVSGEKLLAWFNKSMELMKLHSLISNHLLGQARARYLDFFRATPRKRYELLMRRCPGIVQHLTLQDIASFLNVTPKTISMIRRDITFG